MDIERWKDLNLLAKNALAAALAILLIGGCACSGPRADGTDDTSSGPAEDVGKAAVPLQVAPYRYLYSSTSGPIPDGNRIAIGNEHICASLGDGAHALKCWGRNEDGRLGYGDYITMGDQPNEMGDRLGLVNAANPVYSMSPILNVSSMGKTTCVALGAYDSLGGIVRCWGNNAQGQLGLGDTAFRAQPVNAPAVELRGDEVSVGGEFVCRRLKDGTVRCLGSNYYGELGYGDRSERGSSATDLANEQPVPLGGSATSIATGWRHTCALLSGGQVKCWGSNEYGQLGLGDTWTRGDDPNELGSALPPVDLGNGRTAKTISVGAYHSCALLDNNRVKCWGSNVGGQLGQGDNVRRGTARDQMGDHLSAIDLGTGLYATQLASTSSQNCALLNNGQVKCWGVNFFGLLGSGDLEDRGDNPDEMGDNLPAVDLGTIDGAAAVVDRVYVGSYNTCVVYHSSRVGLKSRLKCWGSNGYGQLGTGDTVSRGGRPNQMGNALPAVNLGSRSVSWVPVASAFPGLGGHLYLGKPIAAGGNQTCAIVGHWPDYSQQWKPGYLKCWGANLSGQLGLGDQNHRGDSSGEMSDNLPYVDLGNDTMVREVAVGQTHACAILFDTNGTGAGALKCWGNNSNGQLGLGDTVRRGSNAGQMGNALPVVNVGTGRTVLHVAAGQNFTCVVLDNNAVKCWGQNTSGQLGKGHTSPIGNATGQMGDNLTPIDLGTTANVLQIVAGTSHACVVLEQPQLPHRFKCWGMNASGQLGLGDTNNRGDASGEMGTNLPYVGVTGYSLAAGSNHTCATNVDGQDQVKCWGSNNNGQLGLGDTASRGSSPNQMGANLPAVSIPGVFKQQVYAGGNSTCVVTSAPYYPYTSYDQYLTRLKCFGANNYGQLGLGDAFARGTAPGSMGDQLPFVDVGLNPELGVSAVAMRSNGVCVVTEATGQIKCWGNNPNGELGLGNTNPLGDQAGEMGNALPYVDLGSDADDPTDHCANLDDNNPCTSDTCSPVSKTVVHANLPNNTSCSDGNSCTTGDVCTAGVCSGSPVTTEDGNPCTIDSCDSATGTAKHVPVSAGTGCNDMDPCTYGDACSVAGTCLGTRVIPPPSTECTSYVCSSGSIVAVYAASRSACDADNNVCTTDTCNGSGVCVAGTLPVVADDGLVCTSESCDPVTGYPLHAPVAKGTACGGSGTTTECDGAGRCAAALGNVFALPAATALGVVGEGSVAERATALYTGTNAVQKQLNGSTAPFVFDQKRVSLVQGRVLGTDSLPLAKVRITIKDHPEYGYTESRVDGKYDLVVEGGGQLSVNFERANYFAAQRSVRVDWDKAFLVEDVVLVKPDLAAEPQTPVQLCTSGCNVSDAMTIHVASATQASAQAGKRGAVMLFPASAQAQVTSSTQTTGPLPSLNVAATEYTRDVPTDESTALAEHFRDPGSKSSGTLAMPGELPSASGYTFAVDLFDTTQLSDPTADVKFTGTALPILYVDNFVGFPVGATVPAGSYDKAKAAWKPEASGQVVRIASVNSSNELVTLDYGTGTAPADMTAEELNALYRLTTATYSSRFKVNDTLWRVKIAHFSPWDCNWPYGPAECSEGGPCADDDPGAANSHDASEDKPNCKPGSTIMCESRVLGENIPVSGTGWDLVYTSERVPGYKAPLEVEMTPPGGTRVKNRWLSAHTQAGSSYFEHAFNGTVYVPTPKDNLGRAINGMVQAKTEIVEHYPAVYNPGYVFGLPANGPRYVVAPDTARAEVKVTHRYEFQVLNFDARSAGLGGWDLSIHHWLDRDGGWIFRGDGTRQKVSSQKHMMERSISGVYGTPTIDLPADGSNWNTVRFDGDMIFASNGDLFLTNTHQRLHQVSWDKTRVPCTDPNDAGPCIRWVAFNGDTSVPLVPADGTPVLAQNGRTAGSTGQIALAPDGSMYILRGWGVFRLYQAIPSSGNPWYVEKVAGTSLQPPASYLYNTPIEGIGGPAKSSAYVGLPRGIAVAADGTVHMLTYGTHPSLTGTKHVLLKIDTNGTRRADGRLDNDGTLRMVIGGGSTAFSSATLPKNAYELSSLPGLGDHDSRLAMAPNGDLYFGQTDLYVMRKNGRVERVTSPNSPTYLAPKEGVLASSVGTLNQGLADIRVDANGNVLLGDTQLLGVRRIDPSGVITTVSGTVSGAVGEVAAPVAGASAVPARLTRLPSITPSRIAIAPNGDIYVASTGGNGSPIFRVFIPNSIGNANCPVAVPSTDGQEVYCFDDSGRHLDTRDSRTCVNRSVTDCAKKFSFTYESPTSGNVSAITDAAGNVTTITRTSGQVQIAPPVGSPTTLLTDAESSYLNRVIDPAGGTWAVTMSSDGLLKSIEDPRGTYRHDFNYDQRGKLNTDGLFNKAASQTEGEQALQSAPGADNQVVKDTNGVPISPTTYATTVKHTSAAGLQTTYDVRRDASGKVARKVTLPTDLTRTTTENPDGSTTTVEPDLVQSTQVLASDPLFGMNAPLSTATTTFPSGRRIDSQRLHVHGPTDSVSVAYGPTGGAMRTTTRTWDPSGRTLSTQSPGGRKSTVVLDTLSRVASMQESGFQASSYGYFNSAVVNGVLRSSTTRGAVTTFDYFADGSAKGYLESVTSPVATLAYNDRDALGRPLNVSVSGSGLASPLVTSFGWNQVGNMTSLTPPGQPAHGQTYAGFNQLASYTSPAMSTVASNSTVFTHDNDRGLTRATIPGRAPISYVKQQGRLDYVLIGPLFAGSRAIDVDYYAATETTNGASPGHIKTITGPGPITSVAPAAVSSGAQRLTYTYDGYLPLSETYSGPITGEVSRTFNSYLDVATQSIMLDATTSTVSYTTDDDGAVTTAIISDVSAGLSASYDSSSNYRLSSATVGTTVAAYSYDTYGALASLGYSSGSTTLFKAEYHQPRGATDNSVSRDAVGRILKMRETRSDGQHAYEYRYDGAGRLTRVFQNNVIVEAYSYDGNGNRTDLIASDLINDPDVHMSDAQDRLLMYGQSVDNGNGFKLWDLTYTDDGALSSLKDRITGATTRYSYDELGNLTKVVLSDNTTIDYIVDGRGRRIGKKRNGALVKAWLYDGQLRIAAEMDVTSGVVSRFVYGTRSNIPDYLVKYGGPTPTGVYRIVADHLGSPRMVVDAKNPATRLLEARYSAFGIPSLVNNTGSLAAIPFGFAGGLYDADTGLVRFGARDYDARLGRWTHKDPILFGGGQTNLYVYVGNDPVNRKDPTGLVDVFWMLDFDNVGGEGTERSVGGVWDSHSGKTGIFSSKGEGLGLNIGAGLGGGLAFRDVEGWGWGFDANIGIISLSLLFDDKGWNGFSVAVGPGIGGSISKSYTTSTCE